MVLSSDYASLKIGHVFLVDMTLTIKPFPKLMFQSVNFSVTQFIIYFNGRKLSLNNSEYS